MKTTKRKQTEIQVLEILRSFIIKGFKISDADLIRVKRLKSTLNFDGNYLISRIKEELEIEGMSKKFFKFFN